MLSNKDIMDQSYKIIERIGAGGGGEIYLAYHNRLEKHVVLKKIKDGVKGKIDLRGEADILKKLNHSYLPMVYDFVEVDEEVYTVIDYIEGASLDRLLKNGQVFKEKVLIKWAKQICEALVYLHKQEPQIIHSDIKPANIMLKYNGDICLIDFNISLIVDENTAAIGKSDGYSPPEQHIRSGGEDPYGMTQLSGGNSTSRNYYKGIAGHIDARSDIYSLGATLYHLYTGNKPRGMPTENPKLHEMNEDVEDGFAYIVGKAMEPDPEERFQSAGEMLDALNNIEKLDRSYKKFFIKRRIITAALILLFALSAGFTTYGFRLIEIEKNDQYYELIENAHREMGDGNVARAMILTEEAKGLYEDRLDHYHLQAILLYEKREYDESIALVNRVSHLIDGTSQTDTLALGDQRNIGDLYYIKGSSLLETGDEHGAVNAFEKAIKMYQGNSNYYRDYGIALARIGDIEEADQVIARASEYGLEEASLMLLRGEVNFEKGEYSVAEESFVRGLELTDDLILKERLFITTAKLYRKMENQVNNEILLLETAKQELQTNQRLPVYEMLGEAYAKKYDETGLDQYAHSAIENFEALINLGYDRYYIQQNMAILYQQLGEFTKAGDILHAMVENQPENYRGYMQLAFLSAEIEGKKRNEERSYHQFNQYYEEALSHFEESGSEDLQMMMLKDLNEEIKDGGWLDD